MGIFSGGVFLGDCMAAMNMDMVCIRSRDIDQGTVAETKHEGKMRFDLSVHGRRLVRVWEGVHRHGYKLVQIPIVT